MRGYDGFRFNLDEYLGIDQAADLDHRGRGPNFAENLAMRAAHLFPFGDVDDVDARAHHIFDARSGAFECRRDVTERLRGLLVGVSAADNFPGGIGGRGPRHVHNIAYAYSARVANDRLPRRVG